MIKRENIKEGMVLKKKHNFGIDYFVEGEILVVRRVNGNIFSRSGNLNMVRKSDRHSQWVRLKDLTLINNNIAKIT